MGILNFKSKSEVVKEDKLNRIFFHDIINHTHGILLFLSQRIQYNQTASTEELGLLLKEVKLLQSLIQNHFKYLHKDLDNQKDFVSFKALENSIDLLLKIYFPNEIKILVEHKGLVAIYEKKAIQENALVYFVPIYRIMNNLIKNMAEAKSIQIEFLFDYSEAGLYIETKNHYLGVTKEKDILDSISQDNHQKNAQISVQGFGLDSINELVILENGTFNFEIENNVWVNKIYIPHRAEVKNKLLKKAV